MPMPAFLQSGLSFCTHLLQQAIGCRSAYLDPGSRSRFLPGMTRLHERNQVSFCGVPLLILHRFPFSILWARLWCHIEFWGWHPDRAPCTFDTACVIVRVRFALL